MFEEMLRDVVTIRTKDGRTFTDIPSSVQRSKIFVLRTDIPIQPGDQVVRRTPAGVDEVFVVDDPGFHSGLEDIPASYQMRVHRADSPSHVGRANTVIYNLTGANARFNINSADSSTNVVNHAPAELFEVLRLAIQSGTPAGRVQQDLLASAAELERDTGKASFAQRYARFMALAANHMDVLAPFVPALTQLLSGWLKGA